MRIWQKSWLVLTAFVFLLLLISGGNRLLGHEEEQTSGETEVLEVVLAAPAAVQSEPVIVHQIRKAPERLSRMEILSMPLISARIRTDANGTVIWGRRSYLHLRYQAFSLSDGFV